MREVRCSHLPRLSACAASAVPPAVKIERSSGESLLGQAFHLAMADFIRGTGMDVPDYARDFRVDAEELWPLVGWGRRVWNETLRHLFPGPIVEEPMCLVDEAAGLTLTGHGDVLALADDEVRGLDWKTGWLDADATDQVRGYAWLGLNRWPEARSARVSVLRVRERVVDTLLLTRDELRAWWADLSARLAGEPDTFGPGEHCGFCPRALECPAHRESLAALAQVVGVTDAANLDAATLAVAVGRGRALQRMLERLMEQARAEVVARGGRYGDLEIVEQQRRGIDLAQGHEILSSVIGADKLLQLARIAKGSVEAAVKELAPRGRKGEAVKELMERLEAADAINITTIQRLEVRRGSAPAIAGGTAGGND